MKKQISILLALCMVLLMAVPVFALEATQEGDYEADVLLNVDPAFTVTIPEDITLTEGTDGYESTEVITVAGVLISSVKKIQVSLASDFTMTDENGNALPYQVAVNGAQIANGDTVAEFSADETEQTSSDLIFTADDPKYAGTYTDTVYFTIAVVDA